MSLVSNKKKNNSETVQSTLTCHFRLPQGNTKYKTMQRRTENIFFYKKKEDKKIEWKTNKI